MALISYSKDSYTRGWNLKIFNTSILKYRINFEKQKGVFHVLGIPFFFSDVKNKTVDKYAEALFKFFPKHDLYICCYSGAGEVYQLALRLKNYIKHSRRTNPCIICTNKKLEQVCKLVLGDRIPIYILQDLRCQFIDEPYERNGKKIYVPLNRVYFTAVEQNITSRANHYFDFLLPYLRNISMGISPVNCSVSEKVNAIRNRYSKIAFLSPEAETLNELPVDYWTSIVTFLNETGYHVYLNAMNTKYDNLDVSSTKDLSYREAIELCSQSDLLVGLRSGFIEIALFRGSPKAIVIYNDFRNTCVTKLTARQALIGFTLKKIPIRNSNKIKEITYCDYTDVNSLIGLLKKTSS